MHIVRLEAENVKRIEAITISPNGNVIVIGGPNGAGKSSALDCIEFALGGKSRLCDMPLHRGTEKGYIILETEQYIVKRTFTENQSSIEVKTAEGCKIESPQALLSKLVGDLSFDPLEFTRMDSKKQVGVLMRILNLDFTELDAEYKEIEQSRLYVGRDEKTLKAQLGGILIDPDAPKTEVVVSELMSKLEQARQINDDNHEHREAAKEAHSEVIAAEKLVSLLESQLADARNDLKACTIGLKHAQTRAEACVDVDTEPLIQQIQNAEAINQRVRSAKSREEIEEKRKDALKQYSDLSEKLRAIEATKAEKISAASFPVPGVTFGEDGILVNGIPFDQASSAEQLQIAVAMGLSANPKLRIILIRDGSLLDENSMTAVAKMAEQYNAQVWMERVGSGKEVSVVIENGRIAEDRIV